MPAGYHRSKKLDLKCHLKYYVNFYEVQNIAVRHIIYRPYEQQRNVYYNSPEIYV